MESCRSTRRGGVCLRAWIVGAVAAGLAGCALGPSNIIKESRPIPMVPLTSPIALVSDTQLHESRGTASRWWSRAGDEFAPVTIRTAQQVIGGPDILRDAIERTKGYELLIHLGDALDVSCESEWADFVSAMKTRKGEWAYAPGNHDGFIVGNFYPSAETRYNVSFWKEVCNEGRYYLMRRGPDGSPVLNAKGERLFDVPEHQFGKEKLIQQYVALDSRGTVKPSTAKTSLKCPDGRKDQCILWSIPDDGSNWAAYLVQAVRLPASKGAEERVYGILLDTTTFEAQPKFKIFQSTDKWAGVKGGITDEQLRAVDVIRSWIPQDAKFILMGHHDVSSWPETSPAMESLMADQRFLRLVVTAHTHSGYWAPHTTKSGTIVELNTGSLIDPPNYYRTLELTGSAAAGYGVRSKRYLLDKTVLNCGTSLPKPPAPHAVEEQTSENDRKYNLGILRWPLVVGSAIRHFFAFWQSKHSELDPQLLVYADLVASIPDDEAVAFDYRVGTDPDYENRPVRSRDALVKTLRGLTKCDSGNDCSAQGKARLLLALQKWMSTEQPSSLSPKARNDLRKRRACNAIDAAWTSAEGTKGLKKTLEDSLVEEFPLPRAATSL